MCIYVESKFSLQKLHVWCQLPSGQWESGTIQSTLGEEALVSLFNGNVSFFFIG